MPKYGTNLQKVQLLSEQLVITVTLAPTMTAPCGSVTVPKIVPVVTCAGALIDIDSAAIAAHWSVRHNNF